MDGTGEENDNNYCWFSCDVMAAMLVPDNKAFLISCSCLYLQHCYCVFAYLKSPGIDYKLAINMYMYYMNNNTVG